MSDNDVEIDVCSDCLMIAANGTLGDEDQRADQAHADKIETEWSGWLMVAGDGEGWFSWHPCGGCGSHLGGNRYSATMMSTSGQREGAS